MTRLMSHPILRSKTIFVIDDPKVFKYCNNGIVDIFRGSLCGMKQMLFCDSLDVGQMLIMKKWFCYHTVLAIT